MAGCIRALHNVWEREINRENFNARPGGIHFISGDLVFIVAVEGSYCTVLYLL